MMTMMIQQNAINTRWVVVYLRNVFFRYKHIVLLEMKNLGISATSSPRILAFSKNLKKGIPGNEVGYFLGKPVVL